MNGTLAPSCSSSCLHIGLRRRGIDHLVLRRGQVFFVLLGNPEEPGQIRAVQDRLSAGRQR